MIEHRQALRPGQPRGGRGCDCTGGSVHQLRVIDAFKASLSKARLS